MKKNFILAIPLLLVAAFFMPAFAMLEGEEPVSENDSDLIATSQMGTESGSTTLVVPKIFRAEGSTTSELKDIPNDSLENFEALIFDVVDYGSITFTESVDLSDPSLVEKFSELEKYVKIGEHFVDIDSNTIPQLNKPAKIVFRNVEAEADNLIIVLKDGNDPMDSVMNLTYNPSTQEASFEVTEFSMYELKVVDQDATYEAAYNGGNFNNSGIVLVLIFGSIASAILIIYLLEKNKGVLTGGK